MPEQTPNLDLPYILPSQAQKHVTHNEALQRLDATVQLALSDIANTPPGDPAEGERFGIGSAPTGAWSGAPGQLAFWQDGHWQFAAPQRGWLAWRRGEDRLHVHDGALWQPFGSFGSLAMLGIAATPDATNRFAIASEASLFTHGGADHRVKVNKAGPGDTASLLFQSGWSGRAEMGLAGSDAFTVKVSGDGAAWKDALAISPEGHVATPHRPVVRASLASGLHTPADGTMTGFTVLSANNGGFSLGVAVTGGTGNRLVVPVEAYYLVSLSVTAGAPASFSAALRVNGTDTVADTRLVAASHAGAKTTVTAIVRLEKDDWVAIHHTGAASLDFGFNGTELQMVALT